jgi:hypothetical protein
LRYAAAITTFAPTMAVLGAKRPQHFAWQFIVLTLLVVLALPSLEAALFTTGNGPLELHAARRWFLVILIAVGLVNYLPTRAWPAACTYAAAQTCLLSDYLPVTGWPAAVSKPLAGLGLMAIAFWLIALGWPRRTPAVGLERIWLDFRDAYGLVWGLRVQERYNATAAKNGWPVRVTWREMVIADVPGSQDAERSTHVASACPDPAAAQNQPNEAVVRGLSSLLRRFVSREWIATRFSHTRRQGTETSDK